jgi:hypothetical protein
VEYAIKLAKENEFNLAIYAHTDSYTIVVNWEKFFRYAHRLPLSLIDHLEVKS